MCERGEIVSSSGLDLAYYSLNGTPDHRPLPHHHHRGLLLQASSGSMGRSLDEPFVSLQEPAAAYPVPAGWPGSGGGGRGGVSVHHHRTGSQPARQPSQMRSLNAAASIDIQPHAAAAAAAAAGR